jgi:drug/metabolite transporter (DMT)-like permease
VTQPAPRSASGAAVVLALLVVYVIWGSTYLAIAFAIETLPPLLSAGVRFVVAGALLLAATAAFRRWRRTRGAVDDREPLRWSHWRATAIVGVLLLLGGNGGVVIAELYIPSGIAAVVVATTPIWLVVLDALRTRRAPSRLAIAGLTAGIIGVAVLLAPVEGIGELNALGVIVVLGAELSWAIGSLYARDASLPRSGALATGMEMLCGGAALLLVGTLVGELGRADPATFSLSSILAIGYLVVFGSILAFSAYTWLLAHAPVTVVGTHAYVNPIVAVALGALLNSEPITPRTIIASVIIIGAVMAMVSGRPPSSSRCSSSTSSGARPTSRLPSRSRRCHRSCPPGCASWSPARYCSAPRPPSAPGAGGAGARQPGSVSRCAGRSGGRPRSSESCSCWVETGVSSSPSSTFRPESLPSWSPRCRSGWPSSMRCGPGARRPASRSPDSSPASSVWRSSWHRSKGSVSSMRSA